MRMHSLMIAVIRAFLAIGMASAAEDTAPGEDMNLVYRPGPKLSRYMTEC